MVNELKEKADIHNPIYNITIILSLKCLMKTAGL